MFARRIGNGLRSVARRLLKFALRLRQLGFLLIDRAKQRLRRGAFGCHDCGRGPGGSHALIVLLTGNLVLVHENRVSL